MNQGNMVVVTGEKISTDEFDNVKIELDRMEVKNTQLEDEAQQLRSSLDEVRRVNVLLEDRLSELTTSPVSELRDEIKKLKARIDELVSEKISQING